MQSLEHFVIPVAADDAGRWSMMLVLVLPMLPMLLPLELPMMVLGLVSDVELTWATIGLRTRGWR